MLPTKAFAHLKSNKDNPDPALSLACQMWGIHGSTPPPNNPPNPNRASAAVLGSSMGPVLVPIWKVSFVRLPLLRLLVKGNPKENKRPLVDPSFTTHTHTHLSEKCQGLLGVSYANASVGPRMVLHWSTWDGLPRLKVPSIRKYHSGVGGQLATSQPWSQSLRKLL